MIRAITILSAMALLSACNGQTPPPKTNSAVAPGFTGFQNGGKRDNAGDLTGKTMAQLQSLFGAPRLTVREGDAVKIQFSGTACILDVYLYPENPGQEALARHVDARSTQNNSEINEQQCIGQLRR